MARRSGPSVGQRIVSDMRARIFAAAEHNTNDMFNDLMVSISTPYPPASRPGRAPHARTEDYLNSIMSETVDQGKSIKSIIWSNSRKSKWLEHGTKHMDARPHFGPCFKRWAKRAAARINAAAKKRS